MEKCLISESIFREYDIRGTIDKTLSKDCAYLIGKGFCSLNKGKGLKNIAVCRDGRLSSPKLSKLLIKGILESGVNVIDIGCGPTPMLYFASNFLNVEAAIMVTGSHNPKNYNGFKIVLKNKSFYGEQIKKLYKHIVEQKFINGTGKLNKKNIKKNYISALLKNSGPFAKQKVIWDCGNGATGAIVSSLVKNIPGYHKVLFSNVDGNFPNHHPDPTIEKNLKHLKITMKNEKADIGISFDGDGDRIGILSKDRNLISGDILTAFLSGSILEKNPKKPIILDVKSSESAIKTIEKQNGCAVISKTGHSLIKEKMREINAPLAGEVSGHIFFNDKWYGFDDAIYTALRFLEEINFRKDSLKKFLNYIPKYFTSSEIRIKCQEEEKFKIIEKIKKLALKDYNTSDLLLIDGVKANSNIGWWLIRASNTEAALICRAEGHTKENLDQLQNRIRSYLMLSGAEEIIK